MGVRPSHPTLWQFTFGRIYDLEGGWRVPPLPREICMGSVDLICQGIVCTPPLSHRVHPLLTTDAAGW